MRNNPLKYTDPSGHRSCNTQQANTGDETCFQNIWKEYKKEKQKELDDYTGYTKDKNAPRQMFAPNIPRIGTVSPETEQQLWVFVQAGDRAVRNVISKELKAGCSCNQFAASLYYADSNSDGQMNLEEYYLSFNQITYGQEPELVLFVSYDKESRPIDPVHAALLVQFNQTSSDESIIIQTNAGYPGHGIYYTTVESNEYFHLPSVRPMYLQFLFRQDVQ